MMLTCDCDCYEDAFFIYEPDTRLTRLATRRGRKCCSCGERINVGDECLRIEMFRATEPFSVDEHIHGEWRRMADRYMCERCAGSEAMAEADAARSRMGAPSGRARKSRTVPRLPPPPRREAGHVKAIERAFQPDHETNARCRALRLEQLTRTTCRWPIETSAGIRFCGAQTTRTYCQRHHALAFAKPARMRNEKQAD